MSDSLPFFLRIIQLFFFFWYILLFFSFFSLCKLYKNGNDKREKEREREVRDWIRWGVNFILVNQGTGWSRSAVSSAVDDEKKITKSTTIRFLDCQSSVPLTRSVKLSLEIDTWSVSLAILCLLTIRFFHVTRFNYPIITITLIFEAAI